MTDAGLRVQTTGYESLVALESPKLSAPFGMLEIFSLVLDLELMLAGRAEWCDGRSGPGGHHSGPSSTLRCDQTDVILRLEGAVGNLFHSCEDFGIGIQPFRYLLTTQGLCSNCLPWDGFGLDPDRHRFMAAKIRETAIHQSMAGKESGISVDLQKFAGKLRRDPDMVFDTLSLAGVCNGPLPAV